MRLGVGVGGAPEHSVEVARERCALEVDVDGLGLAADEAEDSPWQAQIGGPGRHGGCFGRPVGGAGAPRRTTQDRAPDRNPGTDIGERRKRTHRGDEDRQEEEIDERRTECSVVRPTNATATGALKFLTAMGLFIGQTDAFFAFLTDLAAAADAAQRGV
jgi:hypothetical protein